MVENKILTDQEIREYSRHLATMTWYGRVLHTFGAEVLDTIVSQAKHGYVLEIGSSSGFTTREISSIFGDKFQIIGVDVHHLKNSRLRDVVPTFPREEETEVIKEPIFLQADGYFPPFAKDTFKVIFMMNNLYQALDQREFPSDELKVILSNILRNLQPNGFFCISGEWLGRGWQPCIVFQLDEQKKVSVVYRKDYSNVEGLPADKCYPAFVFQKILNALKEIDVLLEP